MQQTINQELNGHPADNGCKEASDYRKEPSKCRECPFTKGCIKDIKYPTKQLLRNSKIILKVFVANEQGLNFNQICDLFPEQSPYTIRNWLNYQDKIKQTLKRFKWVVPYLSA